MRLPVTLAVLSALLLAAASARASSRLPSAEPVVPVDVTSKWTATIGKSANKTSAKRQITRSAPGRTAKLLSQAPMMPSGVISADGSVKPVVTNSPITPNGVISLPNVAPAIYLPPVNPQIRETEIAQLELTQFLYYDYPAQIRQLDSQIAVTQAEIAALQNRLVNYSRFDKFINNANPLFESQQLANVALINAQQQLSNLQYERGRVQQWLPVEIRRRQLGLDRALAPPQLLQPTGAGASAQPMPYNATFDDDKER